MSEELVKIPLQYVDGFPFPEPFFSEEKYREILTFNPTKDDIFVTTYPKCGTTWAMYIVWEIINKGLPPPPPYILMFKEIPFLEFTGIQPVLKMNPPRVLKTHLPYHLNPYNPSSKYIYVYRNPWDCCVSYYFHERDMEPNYESLKFDNYFECFLKGELPWGDYFDHFLSWYDHKDDTNVLYLRFEDMKKDHEGTVLQIARFLGNKYIAMLEDDRDLLDRIVHYTSFKYMKENLPIYSPTDQKSFENLDPGQLAEALSSPDADPEKTKKVEFFRKGKVGDWRNYFSEEQKSRFRSRIVEKLKGTMVENTLMQDWKNME